MTGHIPGTTVLRSAQRSAEGARQGSNQAGLRAMNERLVLSLIRKHGQLSKAQIAELSGLAMQTASVISRSLIDAGLLEIGDLVRGKVGQPSTPLRIRADGAFFLGVHVSAGRIEAALVDFLGNCALETQVEMVDIDSQAVADFIAKRVRHLQDGENADRRARIQGVGVSMESGVLDAAEGAGARSALVASLAELGAAMDLSIHVSSVGSCSCSAELIYGIGSNVEDFLYIFLDDSISGGLVQTSRIRFSRGLEGPQIGKVPVPRPDGRMRPVQDLAVAARARAYDLEAISDLAIGLSHAVSASAALVRFETVILDGSVPIDSLRQVLVGLRAALGGSDMPEVRRLSVREGTTSRKPAALGAACLPLAERFFPDEAAPGSLE